MCLLDKNLNPSVETKPDPFSLGGLIAWLERQPADRRYEWYNTSACLMHAYYSEFLGFETHPTAMLFLRHGNVVHYSDLFGSVKAYQAVCMPTPWTMGAALHRARAYQAKVAYMTSVSPYLKLPLRTEDEVRAASYDRDFTADEIRVIRERHFGWEKASIALLAKIFDTSPKRVAKVCRGVSP